MSSSVNLRLMKLRVPFLYVTNSEKFDFNQIKEDVKPAILKKNATVLSISFRIDSKTDQLRVRAVSCFSLNQTVVAVKVLALVSKMDGIKWSEKDVEKHNQEIVKPVISKVKQLISINTEQLSGVPISVEFDETTD